jgi:hypothetical protein
MEDFTFLQSITLLLIGLLFFRDEIIPWIKEKMGLKAKEKTATSNQVDELAEYVNHRQTEILDKQTAILESIHEGVKDVKRKHDEWERYGIPVRNVNK